MSNGYFISNKWEREEKKITFNLNEEAFQYFNDVTNKWEMDRGVFDFIIGSSSTDIRLKGSGNL